MKTLCLKEIYFSEGNNNSKLLLIEKFLQEIGEHTTALYHRSPKKLKVGDRIQPKLDKKGEHWLASKPFEMAMEEWRKEMKPDAPSRLSCIYSTLVPRSRFIDKGYLYRIRPTGRIHITNSTLIDQAAKRFDREYYDHIRYDDIERKEYYHANPQRLTGFLPGEAKYYWKGSPPSKYNIKNIEVLSDGAVVVEEIKEGKKAVPFKINDNVKVTESKKLTAVLNLYFGSDKDNEERLHYDEQEREILVNNLKRDYFDSNAEVKIENQPSNNTAQIKGTLKKGAKLKIMYIISTAQSADRDSSYKGKYQTIGLYIFIDGKKIIPTSSIKRKSLAQQKQHLHYRFEIPIYYQEKGIYNFANYLRRTR